MNMNKLLSFTDKYLYELAFVLTASATMGSMILSTILTLPPCELCWYQRIFMFPLPAIFFVAILRRDNYSYLYAWPIALVGAIIAFYHTLLQWGAIVEETSTCSLVGPSCAEPEINLLGFMTIPFGALLTFLAVNGLMWRAYKKHHNQRAINKAGAERALNLLVLVAALAILAIALVKLFNVELI